MSRTYANHRSGLDEHIVNRRGHRPRANTRGIRRCPGDLHRMYVGETRDEGDNRVIHPLGCVRVERVQSDKKR